MCAVGSSVNSLCRAADIQTSLTFSSPLLSPLSEPSHSSDETYNAFDCHEVILELLVSESYSLMKRKLFVLI